MTKQCQSCGMPLFTEKAGDCRGSESNGKLSDTWCKLCFNNGKFIDPECTLEEMVDIVDKALVRQGSSKSMRWLARRQIPRLERWREISR